MAIIQGAIQDPTAPKTPTAQSLTAAATAAAPAPAPAPPPAMTTAPIPPDNSVAQVQQPTQWTVTPDQTAEGRIQSIIAANNPIIQAARTHALETANGRGLLNSSMAVQAGEQAAMQAATPIATADAQTVAKAAQYNADQPNQFALKNLEGANQHGLQQLQNDNSKLLQTNNQAATAFNQALVAIANINNNDKMDAAAKTQAIATIQQNLQTQLKTLGATSGLDLTSQLNFASYPGFDAAGNFIGFDAGGNTAGAAPAAAPAAGAPAPTGPFGGPIINGTIA